MGNGKCETGTVNREDTLYLLSQRSQRFDVFDQNITQDSTYLHVPVASLVEREVGTLYVVSLELLTD